MPGQCAPKIVRHKEDKLPFRRALDLETKSGGQEEALRMSPGVRASPQSAVQALCPHTGPRILDPASQWHPCFSTPEQGARRPSPSLASTCHCSALTSVPLSDPRYRSKRHSRPKHHGEGGEQPPAGAHIPTSGLQQGLQQQMLAGSGSPQQGSRWWPLRAAAQPGAGGRHEP